MRVVRLCLLILRLGVAICIALGRARRQDWLGAFAQAFAGGGDENRSGAGDDRDDGDGDREDDDLLLCLAALCRRLGAQAVGATRAVVARPATWRISCVVAAPPRCSSASGSTGS